MDATPPPYSDMPGPPALAPGAPKAGADERRSGLMLDAVKAALAAPGEHRLFRSGKLAGLFPSRAGTAAEAALLALQNGLLETVRTETRGKVVTEWVKATPRAVAFVHAADSPKSVLRELKGVLDATRAGVPAWMADARRELAELSARFESRAAAMLERLDNLAGRVEAALRRAEAGTPAVADAVGRVVPWAVEALEYLDQRSASGASAECTLPELFHAVRVRFPELSLAAFQDGVRRLHDVRALRLTPAAEMSEPEHAVVADGKLMYAAGR
jgi:hypothetical protein